jgi:uncharacterized cupredoxin-like copper-binding protein
MEKYKKLFFISLILLSYFSYAQAIKYQFGKLGKETKVSRTIEIDTYDNMQFVPNKIEIKVGETIKFIIVNKGKEIHEFMLGSAEELDDHGRMMQENPTDIHSHDNSIVVEVGRTKNIIWEFNKEGNMYFACLLPGHSEAEVKGTIQVTTK